MSDPTWIRPSVLDPTVESFLQPAVQARHRFAMYYESNSGLSSDQIRPIDDITHYLQEAMVKACHRDR